jgi:hypothetical protein
VIDGGGFGGGAIEGGKKMEIIMETEAVGEVGGGIVKPFFGAGIGRVFLQV